MKMHQNIHRDINIEISSLFKLNIFRESKAKLIDQYISVIIKNDQAEKSTQKGTSAVSPFLIFTPNPEQIVLSHTDPHFLAALQSADLLVPDGAGVVTASVLLAAFGKAGSIQERITGIDLLQTILKSFPATKVAIIGGRARHAAYGVADHLNIDSKSIPWLPAYRDVQSPTAEEEAAVEQFLKSERPEVVFVAFGAPFQEYWSLRHKALLQKYGVRLVLVVGGAVDVLSGRLKRAPKLVRLLGLEWLFRLFQEPWRWKRQLRLGTFIRLTVRELLSTAQ